MIEETPHDRALAAAVRIHEEEDCWPADMMLGNCIREYLATFLKDADLQEAVGNAIAESFREGWDNRFGQAVASLEAIAKIAGIS